jgi:uncharacterized protein (DUF433 family)
MVNFDKLRFEEELKESPRIEGSRISAIQIYEMHVLKGLSKEDIAEKYGIDRESVRQAIDYCVSHPDEVREQATSRLTIDVAERQARYRKSASA